MKSIEELPERIRAKISVNSESGCWEWTGCRSDGGYGRVMHLEKLRPAHRVCYEILVGPIDQHLTCDHLCRNRGCVNPSHIEPVSMRENVLRGFGPTALHARQTTCKHGHEFTQTPDTFKKKQRMCVECRRIARIKYEIKTGRKSKYAKGIA